MRQFDQLWVDPISSHSLMRTSALANSTEKSCKAGHGMACHHMGLLLLYGKDGGYDVQQVGNGRERGGRQTISKPN